MKNIILYGMRGTGKTSIGLKLAKKLNKTFIDLDVYLEKKFGEKLSDFIEKNGWDIFRNEEYKYLKEVLENNSDIILSLGGGTIIFERNQKIILKNNFKLIYIYSNLEQIAKRIKSDEKNGNKRNSLTGKIVLEELTEVYEKRKEIYEKFYDLKVENNEDIEKTCEQIVEKIIFGNICVPIVDFENIDNQIDIINNSHKIKYVELRIDFLRDLEKLNEIIPKIQKQIILTNRSQKEGGNFVGNEKENFVILKRYGNKCDYVDIELSSLIPHPTPLLTGEEMKNVEMFCQNISIEQNIPLIKGEGQGVRCIISYHNFEKTPSFEELKNILEKMKIYNPDVYKIAVMPKRQEDLEIIYELTTYFKQNYKDKDFIFISMGELGKQTRINIPKMGGLLTFGALKNVSAPGQIDFEELYNNIFIDLDNYKDLTKKNILGVVDKNISKGYKLKDFKDYLQTNFDKKYTIFIGGEQISGSLSPFIHTYSAFLNNYPLMYVLYPIKNNNLILDEIIEYIKKDENIVGANVTMPYKIEIYKKLKELNSLDKSAILVGAVNTIIKKDGNILGLNTDIDGIIEPIKEKIPHLNKLNSPYSTVVSFPPQMRGIKGEINGYILGAGGACKAVIAGLLELGITNISIFNRNQENVLEIKNHFESEEISKLFKNKISIEYIEYDLEKNVNIDISNYIKETGIIVNTLPFGFKEILPKYPIKKEIFDKIASKVELYFDIVYDLNYELTPMSEYINQKYKHINLCNGLEMLLKQAEKGFENWTSGSKLDLEVLKNILVNK